LAKFLSGVSGHRAASLLSFLLSAWLLFWPGERLHGDNFVFYLPGGPQVIQLQTLNQVPYLPLLQTLNVVGKVSGLQEKRDSLKVFFGTNEINLKDGDRTVKVNKGTVLLQDPARVVAGQWLVSRDFVTIVLPLLTHQPIKYQLGRDRVFIGEARPCTFNIRLDHLNNGTRLTLQFSEKISLRTASSNGKWIVYLAGSPVEPSEQVYHFQDATISQLAFNDQDGVPKLILTPAAAGLNFYPSLVEDDKVLIVDVIRPPAQVVQPPPAPAVTPGGNQPPGGTTPQPVPTTPGTVEENPAVPPGPPLPVIVLDAGHGGADSGARSRDGMAEKDIVVLYVMKTRLAILDTKRYRVVLTRVGDIDPTFEQRASAANVVKPIAFVTFHAGNYGTASPRVMVYSLEPSSSVRTGESIGSALLVPWDLVQLAYVSKSQLLAANIEEQIAQLPGISTGPASVVAVKQLKSIAAPAVAVEVGSLSSDADSGAVANPALVQQVANAVASGVESFAGGAK
jgi:N-acetylmuramoyl-L-alanine amidase